ncbi:MAG: flagellar motor switch protein FliY [Campylobacterota bacterium]|nr:flagellar motor switch protein FliY [Campylobacterota bacterium]
MEGLTELFISETIATIEGLTGFAPALSVKEEQDISDVTTIMPPTSLTTVEVSGEGNGRALVAIPPSLATALGDMMLGGEGESKDDMDDEDLDATKEMVSNIIGAMSTALAAQNEMPKLSMKVDDIEFVPDDGDIDITPYSKMIVFSFELEAINSIMMFLVDRDVINSLKGDDEPEVSEQSSQASAPSSNSDSEQSASRVDLNDSEMRNINLLMDVKLLVRVRIGQKRLLLKDVLTMDIGSVIELNQHANDPLDILVDDKVIAQGEVVIVDGNFGVQITAIGSKKDRLKQLKG